jgi:hypothetical protein
MKNLNLLFLFLISLASNAQDSQKIFLKNLSVFENLSEDGGVSLNTIYEARDFLIAVTSITYETEKSLDVPIFPPQKTVKEWRTWYEKNKNKLYWDNKKKTVKVKPN